VRKREEQCKNFQVLAREILIAKQQMWIIKGSKPMKANGKTTSMMIVLFWLLFIAVSFQIGIPCSNAAETIKIGGCYPMTGTGAQYGERMSASALLRVAEENAAGGINGKQIKLVICDHKGVPREGVACANKLIHVHHVPAFESQYSGVVLACAPIVNDNKAVLLNTSAMNPKIRECGPWVFAINPLGDYEGKAQAQFVFNELKMKNAVIMYINNAFGKAMAEVVKNEFERLGGKVLAYEAHSQDATYFRTQLTKIKDLKPEVIFLESYYMEAGLIVKQAKEVGLTGLQWVSYGGIQEPQFIEIAGDAAEGFICTVAGWNPDDPRKIVQDFKKNLMEKHGVEAEMTGAMVYDGIKLLAEVMRKHGTTAEEIRQGLHKVRNFEGVTGFCSIDKDGMVVKEFQLTILKNGQWVAYK
jgi:branched-chain amino acid transport system substrate-binding protein